MAKAEGFKNKITKAQEDLFKALDSEKEKKSVLLTKIVTELTKQNKANVKTLNSLNKEYVELCKQNGIKLDEFVSTVQINVNNYVASCKMFSSSLLYMEIQAIDKHDKITTYQIPINLEDNCKQ